MNQNMRPPAQLQDLAGLALSVETSARPGQPPETAGITWTVDDEATGVASVAGSEST